MFSKCSKLFLNRSKERMLSFLLKPLIHRPSHIHVSLSDISSTPEEKKDELLCEKYKGEKTWI